MVRDNKGRFVKGHENVGAGRKPKSLEEKYLKAFSDSITPEDLVEIVNSLKKKAKNGSIEAARLLLAYLLGMPIQRNEHTGENGGVIRVKLTGND